jgi:1-acyl-sn-glycerol-3-phosphate acyltransferase
VYLQRFYLALRPFWHAYWPTTVHGLEHVPRSGPVIFSPNHASFLDPWFLLLASPRTPIRYLINAPWYNRSWFWRKTFDGWGTIPAVRNPAETIYQTVEAALDWERVGVFPEGRVTQDGKLTRTQHGLGWIAALSGAAVLPTALLNSYQLLPRSRRFPLRGRLEIAFAAPHYFPGAPVLDPDPLAVHQFTCGVVTDMARMLGELDRLEEILPRGPAADLRPLLRSYRAKRKKGGAPVREHAANS